MQHDSEPALNSPTRAIGYYIDQLLDGPRPQIPPSFIAGAATPYISPTGMRQNVGGESPDTSTLNRYPNHFSFLQAATDHLSGFNNATFCWGGDGSYRATPNPFIHGIDEPNREESRVITDSRVYDRYPMWYPGDDAPLLCPAHLPKVETWERGRYIPSVNIPIPFGRTYKFGPWWIWRRVYDLLEGWQTKMGCDYMYESVLQCDALPPCPTCIAPPADLALWLPLDETTGSTVRNLAGGFNGVLYNGFTANGPTHIIPPDPNYHVTPIDGYNGSGLCFDGTEQSVSVPSYNGINVGVGNFTLDAWVMRDLNAIDSHARIILDKRDPQSLIGYSLAISLGNLLFQLSDGTGSPTYTNYRDSAVVPVDGLWHFVAVTVDRNTAAGGRFYIDGNPTGTFNPTAHAHNLNNTAPFILGETPIPGGFPWLGCIDEVELFRRALGAPEIQSLYGAKWEGKCKFACHVPPALTICMTSNSLDTAAQICNYSVVPQAFNYSFQGCTAGLIPTFTPPLGTVTVQPGQCATIPVTMTRPNPGGCCPSFCYQMTMQPAGSSETFQSTGYVTEVDEICSRSPSSQPATAAGTNQAVILSGFQLANNSGTNQTPHYRWIVLDILGLVDTSHVSLNGLPPGTPVTNSVTLAAGANTNLAVSARFVLPDPFGFYNVVLQSEVNGTWVSLASYSLQYVDMPSEQPPLVIVVSGSNIVVSWNASGPCHVQSATQLQSAITAWTDVPGLSPVTIPTTETNQFFRLVCP